MDHFWGENACAVDRVVGLNRGLDVLDRALVRASPTQCTCSGNLDLFARLFELLSILIALAASCFQVECQVLHIEAKLAQRVLDE